MTKLTVTKRAVSGTSTIRFCLTALVALCVLGLVTGSRAQSASFVGLDTTTKGDWVGHYGGDGYTVVGGASAVPSYAKTVSAPNASFYQWNPLNYDVKALYKSKVRPDRVAATWYNTGNTPGGSFTIDVPITDTAPHQVALFCSDYDNGGRAETISVQSPSGTVLGSHSISDFSDGRYLIWNVRGHVQFVVTQTSGTSGVVSGIFFDRFLPPPPALGEIDVTRYGAAGNGKTDNTAAFQAALDVASRTGAIVKVPAGQYYFGSQTHPDPSLEVPDNVVLEGVNAGDRSDMGSRNGAAPNAVPNRGTVFLVGYGANGTAPFITLNGNSALRNVTIYYPRQPLSTTAGWIAPTPYPDTIYMTGTSSSVDNVCGINPYSFITKRAGADPAHPDDGAGNVRSNVRHVSGQPLKQGLLVDSNGDVTRYEDIRFAPTWDSHAAMTHWMLANAWAFTIYRGDDMKFTDCSASGYNRGFFCGLSKSGTTASGFQSCAALDCCYGVWISATPNDAESVFHGCAFSSNLNTDGAAVMITSSSNGNVAFDGCRFWQARHALFLNQSTSPVPSQPPASVTIVGCSFDTWGTQSTGPDPTSAAILCGDPSNPGVRGGKTIITDCAFNLDQYNYAVIPGALGVLYERSTSVSSAHVRAANVSQPIRHLTHSAALASIFRLPARL